MSEDGGSVKCQVCGRHISAKYHSKPFTKPLGDGKYQLFHKAWIDLVHVGRGGQSLKVVVGNDMQTVLTSFGKTEEDARRLRAHTNLMMSRLMREAHPEWKLP